MQVSIKQLRKLVMEAVEAELKEQDMDEGRYDGYGSYRGESQWISDTSPERSYTPETEDERQRRLERDAKSSREFSDSYNQSSRYDESRKPKGLTLEALRKLVREAIEENMDEYTYSRGGAGGNRHGDSWDEAEPERGYRPKSQEEKDEENERARKSYEEFSRSYDQSSRYDESRKRKGLALEAIRRMVRSAVVAESRKRAGK